MTENPICLDETLDRLETQLKSLTSRPDSRRRWTRQVIERLRVSERAAALLRERREMTVDAAAEWDELYQQAIVELRREGQIR
jgi:uncharacterized membrane protein YccC